MKAIRAAAINSCRRKLSSDVVHDFIGFIAEPGKKLMKEIVDMAKKKKKKRFQDKNLGEVQE